MRTPLVIAALLCAGAARATGVELDVGAGVAIAFTPAYTDTRSTPAPMLQARAAIATGDWLTLGLRGFAALGPKGVDYVGAGVGQAGSSHRAYALLGEVGWHGADPSQQLFVRAAAGVGSARLRCDCEEVGVQQSDVAPVFALGAGGRIALTQPGSAPRVWLSGDLGLMLWTGLATPVDFGGSSSSGQITPSMVLTFSVGLGWPR